MFSNQISVAINDRDGIPERLARRLEQVVNLPFGWFDQPFPERELRASIARGVRLRRKLKMYDLDKKFARSSKMKMQQIEGAPSGTRGVSKALYLQVVAALVAKDGGPSPRRSQENPGEEMPLYARVLDDLEKRKHK